MNKRFTLASTVALMLVTLWACDDDITVVEPPAQRTNRIVEFKIVNVPGAPIIGAVNDNDNTITVYLPYHYYLTVLAPEIKVPEGSSVSPASGTLIENLMDYFENGRTIAYTVTAPDGSRAVYNLEIQVLQPSFRVDELSDDASNPTVFTNTAALDPFTLYWSGQTPVFENAEININVIRVTLTGENGLAYTFSNTNAHAGVAPQFTEDLAQYFLPDDPALLPPGRYTAKIRFYSRSVTLNHPIIIAQQP